MAERLEFDTPTKDERRAPAGPPSVPISGDNLTPEELKKGAPPTPPISTANLDLRRLEFDEPSEAQKSVARIREIADKMNAGAPYHPGPLDFIADRGSLGLSRPLSAAVGATTGGLFGSYPGSTWGERYKAADTFMNERADQAERATGPIAPVVGAAASLPLSMYTGGGSATAKAITGGTAAPVRTVAGAATNPVTAAVRSSIPATSTEVAARAAIPGFIEGAASNADSLENAIKGGASNAASSALLAGGLDKGMKFVMPAAGRAASAEATAARGRSPDEIKAEARTYYKQMDNAGVRYDATQTAPLYNALHDMRNSARYSEASNSPLKDHWNNLTKLSRNEMSYTELQNYRSALATEARTQTNTPHTRAAASEMRDHIDDVIRQQPAVNPAGINMQDAHGNASRLWRAGSLADDIGWIADKTERKMAVNSGANPDATTRANFGALEQKIEKPGAYSPFGPKGSEERDQLSKIIRGDKVQNTQAALGNTFRGRFAPYVSAGLAYGVPTALGIAHGSSPMLANAIGAASAGVGGGLTNTVGKLLQASAASRGQENVNALLRTITNSPKPVPGAAISRDDLTKLLFSQDLARFAPRIGSALIGNQQEPRP